MSNELSPGLILSAYAQGIFPMADEDGEIYWFSPDPRAIIELDGFHVSRTLRRVYRRGVFELAVDRDFAGVMEAWAGPWGGSCVSGPVWETRTGSWISLKA